MEAKEASLKPALLKAPAHEQEQPVDNGRPTGYCLHVARGLSFLGFAVGNTSLNIFNQWALNRQEGPKFTFPVFYTMWHMLVSAVAAWLLAYFVAPPELGMPSFRQLFDYKFCIIPIAYCTTVSNWLNNESFTELSLFLNQNIRALGPLPTVVFTWLFANRTFSYQKLMCVAFIIIGTGLACAWELSHSDGGNSTSGIIVCIISMVIASLKPVIAMIVMQGTEKQPRLDPVVVLFYDSALASVFMSILPVASAPLTL